MGSIYENFNTLNNVLLKQLDFFNAYPVEPIDFLSVESDFPKKLSEKILAGEKYLKEQYHEGYIQPLIKNLSDIIVALTPVDKNNPTDDEVADYVYLTLLANAGLQPAQPEVAQYLSPVQDIVNDIYISFLRSREKLGIKFPLDHNIPPLVGFVGPLGKISEKAPFPSTFEVEQMKDWLGPLAKDFKVGAVVLPAGYKDAPLLWGALGHEVGGHYVLTAGSNDELLRELSGKIYDMARKIFSKEIAALWLHWAEEAAADVCGVLTMGPSFGIGAISFYTAQLHKGKWTPNTGDLEAIFYKENRHPTPVLVPHVISGAVEGLKKLGPSRKVRYMAQLDEIAKPYSIKYREMKFPNKPTLDDKEEGPTIELPDKLPLDVMQKSARQVGNYIATVDLNALDGRTLQDLATWGDDDENAAITMADQLVNQKSDPVVTLNGTMAKPLQLLTGGILAVIRQPTFYRHINEVLLKQLGCNRAKEMTR